MKRSVRRLALTMGTLVWLAMPGAVQANLFGTGNNGVHADQQRGGNSNNGAGNSNNGAPPAGPPFVAPRYNPPLPQHVDTSINQVPEPQTLGLVAIGLLAAWAVSRRRKD